MNKYFTINEFKCKCGKCELPNGMPPEELINILTEIREYYNKPLIIKSGYRCPEHNEKVGGAKKSRHIVGDAVDFIIKDTPTLEVYDYILSKYGDKPYGIAIKVNITNKFQGFIHLDIRGVKARWTYN